MVLFNNKTSYPKLLNMKSRTGLALFKSLANHVWDFVIKIKYKLLQTRPHTEATLCRSLVAKVWGLVFISNNQTLMFKKLLQVLVLVLLVFPFVSKASTVTLDSTGCTAGYKFSTTTGKSCTQLSLQERINQLELENSQLKVLIANLKNQMPNEDCAKVKQQILTITDQIDTLQKEMEQKISEVPRQQGSSSVISGINDKYSLQILSLSKQLNTLFIKKNILCE